MPKERQHLLLATEAAALLERTGHGRVIPEGHLRSFLLGAISPDCHFYDVPTFALTAVGNAFHRLNAEIGLEAVRSLLSENAREELSGPSAPELVREPALTPARRAYALGIASHFLADRRLHPVIDALAAMRRTPGSDWEKTLGSLTPKDRHVWIESDLDARWTPAIGPPDGFLPLLADFQRDHAFRKTHLPCLRGLLRRAGISPLPDVSRLDRAMSIQIAMLRGFCGGRFTFLKERLMRLGGFAAYLGGLVVPRTPKLPRLLDALREKDPSIPDLAGGALLAETVVTIASGLAAL